MVRQIFRRPIQQLLCVAELVLIRLARPCYIPVKGCILVLGDVDLELGDAIGDLRKLLRNTGQFCKLVSIRCGDEGAERLIV